MGKSRGPGKKTFASRKPLTWREAENQHFLKSEKTFVHDYIAVYPDVTQRWDKGKNLHYDFYDVLWWFDFVINNKNHSFSHLAGSTSLENTLGNRSMWLFYNFSAEDFTERMRALVIAKNDDSLQAEEYALLLFISYQDEETQNNLKDMPLNMLHDIFAPISDKNFAEWQKR
jgi:hypothetical protein